MNKKFLITLLTSSNEKLLKLSYESVINQKNHNLDYNVIIVVNSLDGDYYKDVCEEFSHDDVEIVETESNGKPGKGHNSLFEIFRNHKQYDYLIPVDGDDFLYPFALHQISKMLMEHESDILVLQGNDLITWYNDSTSSSDIYLHDCFYLIKQHEYPSNKWDTNKELVNINPFTEGKFITPIRTILCSRKILNLGIEKYYCENCFILDDYLFYLHFLQFYVRNQLKLYIINSNHIYLYNDLNINSVHNIYKLDNDYNMIKEYQSQFIDLCNHFKASWNNLELPFIYILGPFKETYENYKVNGNVIEILDYDKYLQNESNLHCIEFSKKTIYKLYNIFKDNIDQWLLNKKYEKAYELCLKLIENGIYDKEIFNYICISAYFINKHDIIFQYINKAKPLCYKYNFLKNFI